jgi:hypothetical protein
MNKPPPMHFVADPPPLWGMIIDVLIAKLQDFAGATACPPWAGEHSCPLKPGEQCPGEPQCWLLWAYTLAVMRIATESMRQATGFHGKGD